MGPHQSHAWLCASVVVSRVLAAARPGEIVRINVGSHPDALAQVISGLGARGYSFVTLDALTS
jgi:hypothetical protein